MRRRTHGKYMGKNGKMGNICEMYGKYMRNAFPCIKRYGSIWKHKEIYGNIPSNIKIYGKIWERYWKNIGNIEIYWKYMENIHGNLWEIYGNYMGIILEDILGGTVGKIWEIWGENIGKIAEI